MASRSVIYDRNEPKVFSVQRAVKEQTGRDLSNSEVVNMLLDNIEGFQLTSVCVMTLKIDPAFKGANPPKRKRTQLHNRSNFATDFLK